jgi:hypothetical protein
MAASWPSVSDTVTSLSPGVSHDAGLTAINDGKIIRSNGCLHYINTTTLNLVIHYYHQFPNK